MVNACESLKPNQAIWLPLRYAGDAPPGTVKSVGENSKVCPNAAVAADSAICSSLGRFSIWYLYVALSLAESVID